MHLKNHQPIHQAEPQVLEHLVYYLSPKSLYFCKLFNWVASNHTTWLSTNKQNERNASEIYMLYGLRWPSEVFRCDIVDGCKIIWCCFRVCPNERLNCSWLLNWDQLGNFVNPNNFSSLCVPTACVCCAPEAGGSNMLAGKEIGSCHSVKFMWGVNAVPAQMPKRCCAGCC